MVNASLLSLMLVVLLTAQPPLERIARAQLEECASLPVNVAVPENLRPVIDRLLLRSATFRRQCREIGGARQLQILVRVPPVLPDNLRALSTVRRLTTGRITVVIDLPLQSPNNYVELLGHEFEHALEQAEGLNLKQLADQPGSHVYRLRDGKFETERANAAGKLIVQEFIWGRKVHNSVK